MPLSAWEGEPPEGMGTEKKKKPTVRGKNAGREHGDATDGITKNAANSKQRHCSDACADGRSVTIKRHCSHARAKRNVE